MEYDNFCPDICHKYHLTTKCQQINIEYIAWPIRKKYQINKFCLFISFLYFLYSYKWEHWVFLKKRTLLR